jgi:hypothetical protein
LVKNQEFDPKFLKEAFQEVVGETTQSVFVGKNNLRDIAFDAEVQKPLEARALPVEPGSNVGDEFIVWVLVPEELLLTFEIWLLLCGRDSGVEDALSVSRGGFVALTKPHNSVNACCLIAPGPTWQFEAGDSSITGPFPESGVTDLIL